MVGAVLNPIPEPTSAMLFAGLGFAGMLRRKRAN